MRVMFLDSIEEETFGGMEEWIRLVASSLVERKHFVAVAGRPNSEFLRRVKNKNENIAVYPLQISGDFHPSTIRALSRLLKENKIELLVVNFNKDVRLGGMAAKLAGKVKVLWSLGLDITKNSILHKLLTPRFVHGVLVPSQALKKQITRFGYIKEDQVEVIPIGIPDKKLSVPNTGVDLLLRKKYQLPENSLIAVTVARFVEQKGHAHLIEAAPAVIDEHPDIRFLFLGDGPLREGLEQKINNMGYRFNFIFAGMLEDFDLELEGANLMIHPSIEEPFGIALLEGMRASLPIVASDVGGIPEVVEPGITAVLVPPGDAFTLGRTVNKLLEDSGIMIAMGNAGRERWESKFQYEMMMDRIEDYFKMIAA